MLVNRQLLIRVGLSGLEPLTPALSAQCSNRLSYRPKTIGDRECYIPDRQFIRALAQQVRTLLQAIH